MTLFNALTRAIFFSDSYPYRKYWLYWESITLYKRTLLFLLKLEQSHAIHFFIALKTSLRKPLIFIKFFWIIISIFYSMLKLIWPRCAFEKVEDIEYIRWRLPATNKSNMFMINNPFCFLLNTQIDLTSMRLRNCRTYWIY